MANSIQNTTRFLTTTTMNRFLLRNLLFRAMGIFMLLFATGEAFAQQNITFQGGENDCWNFTALGQNDNGPRTGITNNSNTGIPSRTNNAMIRIGGGCRCTDCSGKPHGGTDCVGWINSGPCGSCGQSSVDIGAGQCSNFNANSLTLNSVPLTIFRKRWGVCYTSHTSGYGYLYYAIPAI